MRGGGVGGGGSGRLYCKNVLDRKIALGPASVSNIGTVCKQGRKKNTEKNEQFIRKCRIEYSADGPEGTDRKQDVPNMWCSRSFT